MTWRRPTSATYALHMHRISRSRIAGATVALPLHVSRPLLFSPPSLSLCRSRITSLPPPYCRPPLPNEITVSESVNILKRLLASHLLELDIEGKYARISVSIASSLNSFLIRSPFRNIYYAIVLRSSCLPISDFV